MLFSKQERNNGNQNDDDNPWDSNLFHDMQLDEVCSIHMFLKKIYKQ